jgi:CubicO group peptidase (beta-lactamase class C family)
MMGNWNAICNVTAEMKPLWEPGIKISYHLLTYGWILGKIIRRVDGRPISQFLQDEICQPLGIEDMNFGISPEKEYLEATLKNAPGLKKSLIDLGVPLSHPMAGPAGMFNLSNIRRAQPYLKQNTKRGELLMTLMIVLMLLLIISV